MPPGKWHFAPNSNVSLLSHFVQGNLKYVVWVILKDIRIKVYLKLLRGSRCSPELGKRVSEFPMKYKLL